MIIDHTIFDDHWTKISVSFFPFFYSQEALPGQINVVYTIQPGQFWQKKQNSRGHSKEKGKLEFSVSVCMCVGGGGGGGEVLQHEMAKC